MSDAQRRATDLAQHYFRLIALRAGVKWDGDNDTEIDLMVGHIIDAAEARLRGQLADVLEQIRVLDRLRPTCVICRDAAADRQTARGPACTDCVGDLPDDGTGADPDRPETWAFAEPAAAEGAGRDTAVPGTRRLATLTAGAAAQECTYCHAGLGVPCVTGPDGWHLARFLGVLDTRADARLVGAAATPHGDMGGIVRDTSPEVTP